jgi:uncharacterized membrane protein
VSFESGRSMGRAGSLLIVLTTVSAPIVIFALLFSGALGNILFFTVAYAAASFIGQILFLIAMNKLAYHYGKPAIFRNALYAFLTGVVGAILYSVFLYGSFSSLRNILPTMPPTPSGPEATSFLFAFIVFFFVIWIGAFILALVQSLFYRWAFYALADASGEGNFRQAGLFMLIGGVLTIVLVGALIFFIGWIFATMGFFSMRLKPSQQVPPQVGKVRYCPNCGKENSESDIFCSRCGTRLWQ